MRKVTLKGLLAHKLRLALTALAIVLGVTFISGSLILTDTLHDTFTTLVGNIYQHIDFEVRGQAVLNSGASAVRNPIPESLLAKVRRVPGVGLRRRFGHRLRPVRGGRQCRQQRRADRWHLLRSRPAALRRSSWPRESADVP